MEGTANASRFRIMRSPGHLGRYQAASRQATEEKEFGQNKVSDLSGFKELTMVSVVVPIYNEEDLIVQFHAAVADALQSVVEEWEVVYVNDGSTDSSLELLKGLQCLDSHVVVADLSRNWGHPGAVSAGLRTASGRAVILMDGDFQDPPEVLPELIDAWRSGAEVVVGVRRSRQERRKVLATLFPIFYRVLALLPHGSQGR